MRALAWWDWLTLSAAKLKELGRDPATRFSTIGHKRALSLRWARTVGHWCLDEPRELMKRAGLDYTNDSDRSAYNQFRLRWKTKSIRQAAEQLRQQSTPMRYVLAESAYAAVAEALDGGSTYMRPLPYGEALKTVGSDLGILPVEADLYYSGLTIVCEHHGFSNVLVYFEQTKRYRLWLEAGVHPWLPDVVANQYAQANDKSQNGQGVDQGECPEA